MLNKTIWVIITVIIALVMLFGNRKAKVTQILAAQLRVFRNAKTRKTSIFTAILSIVVLEVYDSIAKKILTACIYSAVLMIAMLILMILKRIFALFIDNDKTI